MIRWYTPVENRTCQRDHSQMSSFFRRGLKYINRRRYGRKYIRGAINRRGGLSLVQIASRMRADPPNKRRKYNLLSSQNDDDPMVSVNKQQSSFGQRAPLSVVRFKDPSASVFDYHHYVKRIEYGRIYNNEGAVDTVSNYQISVLANTVEGWANLQAVYERYRITRLVFDAVPVHNAAYNGGSNPADMVTYGPWRGESNYTTWSDVIDDGDFVITDAGKGFSYSCTPNTNHTDTEQESGAHSSTDMTLAPWLSTTDEAVYHCGVQIMIKNAQAYNPHETRYHLFITLYMDFDNTK